MSGYHGYISADHLRSLFNTQAAREAFDAINALANPQWVLVADERMSFLLYANISIRKGSLLEAWAGRWGNDLDEIVIGKKKALIDASDAPDTRVIVHAQHQNRAEFIYDKADRRFRPLAA
jgi:hypothetical protein